MIFPARFLALDVYRSWMVGRSAPIILSADLPVRCNLFLSSLVAEHVNLNVIIFFLSDSTTRPSDLPLYVIVESGNSRSGSLKSVFKWPRPFWGNLGRNENRPRPLPLTPMLNPFFHKTELSMHSLWLPGGLALLVLS